MNRIKQLRLENGVSLARLSDVLKAEFGLSVSAPSLMRYETGDTEPKLATWRKLSDYFEVSFEYLVGWTDERRRNGKY